MNIFIDTSSLVKRYIDETGSAEVDEVFMKADTIYVSPVTHMEFISALTRRLFDKSIDEASFNEATEIVEGELNYFEVIQFNNVIENSAIRLIGKHGMKTLDAVQLASAISANVDLFIVSDKRLFVIAGRESGVESIFI